jgi:hypothetical protein
MKRILARLFRDDISCNVTGYSVLRLKKERDYIPSVHGRDFFNPKFKLFRTVNMNLSDVQDRIGLQSIKWFVSVYFGDVKEEAERPAVFILEPGSQPWRDIL